MTDDDPPILNYANPGRLVTIARFRDESMAHMAASKLQSEGIEAVVGDEVRTAGARRPANLNVLADDVQAAIAILNETPARNFLIDCKGL